MDVLGALIAEIFARTHRRAFHDIEWHFASGEGTPPSWKAARSGKEYQSGLLNSESRHEIADRTAWGSYTEQAPPVLPPNVCVPGFEDEVLLAIRRQKDDLDNDGPDDTHSEREQSELDGEGDNSGKQRARRVAFNAPTRRSLARDGRRLPFSTALSLFPTILSHHARPSSLFGSATRPAATTLQRIVQQGDNSKTSRRSLIEPRMAAKTHLWISLWFLLTAPVIFWDAGYCFMRPRSFKGGDLHWIWRPYEIYQEVDYVYGVEAYHRGDGFANAQSFLNVIETLLNLYYVYAQHILASPAAPLVGFAAAVMTLSKTVLYWAQEYFCGGCAIGHNDFQTLFWLWILPNGFWLLIPSLIIRRLGRDIADGLTTASKINAAKKD